MKQRYICPECKGKAITYEGSDGFKVCGLCKGKRSVYSIDESYHHERSSLLQILFGHRDWTDVVRIRAIPNKRGDAKGFRKLARFSI